MHSIREANAERTSRAPSGCSYSAAGRADRLPELRRVEVDRLGGDLERVAFPAQVGSTGLLARELVQDGRERADGTGDGLGEPVNPSCDGAELALEGEASSRGLVLLGLLVLER